MGFASVMRNIHFGFTHNKLMFASIVFLVRSIPCRVLLKKKTQAYYSCEIRTKDLCTSRAVGLLPPRFRGRYRGSWKTTF